MAGELASWNQEPFDRTLKEYLLAHESEVWPRACNEKAYNVAYKAAQETPVKEVEIIETELAREISVKEPEPDGRERSAPIGFVIASKRASKVWSYAKSTSAPEIALSVRFGKGDRSAQWHQAVTQQFKSMLGGRKRSAGFMALGWWQAAQALSPFVRHGRGPAIAVAKVHGRSKGEAVIATAQNLLCTIENMAHSLFEKHGGFERIGWPAVQRAMERETANMEEYLSREMQPGIEKFNAQQR